jgi:hypothetical protein
LIGRSVVLHTGNSDNVFLGRSLTGATGGAGNFVAGLYHQVGLTASFNVIDGGQLNRIADGVSYSYISNTLVGFTATSSNTAYFNLLRATSLGLTGSAYIDGTLGVTGDATFSANANVGGQGYSPLNDIGSTSGNVTVDWNNGNSQKVTIIGSTTLSYSNAQSGGMYALQINIGATGATVTWPTGTKWPDGVTATLSQNVNTINVASILVSGTDYLTVNQKGFA